MPKPNPEGLLRQAQLHDQAGRQSTAVSLYQQVLELEPKASDALFGLGRIIGKSGNRAEGIRLIRQAIGLKPKRPQYHVSLADLLVQSSDRVGAVTSAQRAITLDPQNVAAYCVGAYAYDRLNQLERALAMLHQALSVTPDDSNARILLARVQRRQGRHQEARRQLQELLGKGTLHGYLLQKASQELGIVLDRIGEYDAAFQEFQNSRRETSKGPVAQQIDRNLMTKRIENDKAGLTSRLLRKWSPPELDDDHPAPGFLVGFPRSGTTLTEQILAAHPGVITSDEKPFTSTIKDEMVRMLDGGDSDDVPAMLDRLDRDRIVKLRTLYWQQVISELGVDLADKVFVDKLPLNITDIGLINVLFPDARVIVALRDPRDVCLSCFMQDFQLNIAMINFLSLERTAEFYAQVMGLWLDIRDKLTLRFLEVRYEDTVADLEAQARRMLEFLGAQWDERVLRFHEQAQKRVIHTPSFAAVTEPVHDRAIGRWRNYATHFKPMMDRLQPFIEAFGYR